MLIHLYQKHPLYYNASIREYCLDSTKKFVQKQIEKCHLERNQQNSSVSINRAGDFYKICFFLSISSIAIYFGRIYR